MADYPDWVLKHKKKGTYINCVKGKYYLYAAHSKRVPGTKTVKRVFDGYLGRITEEDGFIPTKDKVDSDVLVYEFGLSFSILILCKNIYSGFKRTSPKNADFIMVSRILNVVKEASIIIQFDKSYLSILFPSLDINSNISDNVLANIKRGTAMINDYIDKLMGKEHKQVFTSLMTLASA